MQGAQARVPVLHRMSSSATNPDKNNQMEKERSQPSADAKRLWLTVLGSGTSMGVPTLGCPCRVCRSSDPRDNRTRPSVLLSRDGRNLLIDTTPDFRFQALRVGLQRLDAVVFTHAHADHILGFDDIRPFNMRQKSEVPV